MSLRVRTSIDAPEVPTSSVSHVVVYTESALVEQTTPLFTPVSDAAISIGNTSLPDLILT